MELRMDLEHRYGEWRLRVDLDVSFSMLAVFGPSGAGKTSLLNFLAGTDRPDRGRISLDDRVLFDDRNGIFVPPPERNLGYLMQDAPLFPHLTVRQNIEYSGRMEVGNEPGREILSRLELTSLIDRDVSELSGGERRRVALARTLFSDPDLLLLDEPLVSLDERLRFRILPYLRRALATLDVPVILVSHRPEEVLALCESLVPLREGTAGRLRTPGSYFQSDRGNRDGVVRRNYLRGMLDSASSGDLRTVRTEGGAAVRVPDRPMLPGEGPVVIEFGAEDLILGKQISGRLSPRNRWTGSVSALEHAGTVLGVRVSIDGGEQIWVRISPSTGEEFNLAEGERITVMLKSQAVTVHPV